MHKHISPFPVPLTHSRRSKKTTHSIFPKTLTLVQIQNAPGCTNITNAENIKAHCWPVIITCSSLKRRLVHAFSLNISISNHENDYFYYSWKTRTETKQDSEQKFWPGSQNFPLLVNLKVSYRHPKASTLVPLSGMSADSLYVASHPVAWLLPERTKGVSSFWMPSPGLIQARHQTPHQIPVPTTRHSPPLHSFYRTHLSCSIFSWVIGPFPRTRSSSL